MKHYIVLNPSLVDTSALKFPSCYRKIETLVKYGIAREAKRSIYQGRACDLTEFFSKEWIGGESPEDSKIILKPEAFREIMLQSFEVVEETDNYCFLKFHF